MKSCQQKICLFVLLLLPYTLCKVDQDNYHFHSIDIFFSSSSLTFAHTIYLFLAIKISYTKLMSCNKRNSHDFPKETKKTITIYFPFEITLVRCRSEVYYIFFFTTIFLLPLFFVVGVVVLFCFLLYAHKSSET